LRCGTAGRRRSLRRLTVGRGREYQCGRHHACGKHAARTNRCCEG
jgi:hypothetical protein